MFGGSNMSPPLLSLHHLVSFSLCIPFFLFLFLFSLLSFVSLFHLFFKCFFLSLINVSPINDKKPKGCMLPRCTKKAFLVKLGHVVVFPLMSNDRSVCLQLSPTTSHCCSCSFSLQAAYMLLSGTSVNHRVEVKQL